jgi:ABC-type phosphate transport system ATPase subunit
MNIILGPRGCGKTTQLIILASCNNQTIVCATKAMCEGASRMALENGIVINEPITFSEFLSGKKPPVTSYIIDNIDYCLNMHFGGRQTVTTVTLEHGSENNFINLRYGGHRL